VDSSLRILTGLSQYPVFKVQTQRRITLSVVYPAVKPLVRGPSVTIAGPARSVPRRRRTPPLLAEALGRPHSDHRKMARALSDRILELAVYQAGTPFPEGTRPKRPAYVTTGSVPTQGISLLLWFFLIPTRRHLTNSRSEACFRWSVVPRDEQSGAFRPGGCARLRHPRPYRTSRPPRARRRS